MKLARTGVIAAAILAIATVAYAQKPDFSGTWTLDPDASGMTGGGGGRGGGRGMAGPMVVKMAGDTLMVERQMGGNAVTTTYKLDGSESINKQTMGRGENAREVETKSTAKWDGSKLVISTQRPGMGGEMMTATETWSLEGGNLVIESTGGRGGGSKRVYKKTT
ncbi:MAG TPA: hypothetical protein VGD94_11150 [Vicinamibacterales bacterium]